MQRALVFLAIALLAGSASAETNLKLESHRGRVVLVDLWASWCIPCRRSFPWMNAMLQKYADDGLVIVAVNLDSDRRDADRFLKAYPADFSIQYDPNGVAAREYQVDVMPTSILLGRDGEPVERHAGFKVRQQDEYEALIRQALFKENES